MKIFTYFEGKPQVVNLNKLAKLRISIQRDSKSLVKTIINCLNGKAPTKFELQKYYNKKIGFNKKWLFKHKKLNRKDKKIKTKRLNLYNQRISACKNKFSRMKARWNKFFGVTKRIHLERINKEKSIRLKKYLKKVFKKSASQYKLKTKRSAKRLKRRCNRITKNRKRYIKRYRKYQKSKKHIKTKKNI